MPETVTGEVGVAMVFCAELAFVDEVAGSFVDSEEGVAADIGVGEGKAIAPV